MGPFRIQESFRLVCPNTGDKGWSRRGPCCEAARINDYFYNFLILLLTLSANICLIVYPGIAPEISPS